MAFTDFTVHDDAFVAGAGTALGLGGSDISIFVIATLVIKNCILPCAVVVAVFHLVVHVVALIVVCAVCAAAAAAARIFIGLLPS
ncbi:Hypothetical predicted protein [Octopus vulgaris]|uniref:Uncharacterized protein n=1 Tax=Octopus vulgaris TaxID=6645 RepID=A0AA36FDK5_OCTVU|nr:Hypothetical predicted protein [Octopus vulgaris]